MAPLIRSTHIKWSSTRSARDERSPATTSVVISIPGTKSNPIPQILKDHDTGAGRIHHHRDNITDYGPRDPYPPYKASSTWQEQRISATEAQITCAPAPSCWTERVGVVPPPGFGPKKVVVKKVDIVPGYLPPCQNKREIAKFAWRVKMKRELETQAKMKRELKAKTNAYVVRGDKLGRRCRGGDGDSGYETEEGER